MQPNTDIRYGFKFLDPYGRTIGRDMPGFEHKPGQKPATQYPLPAPGQKWSEWLEHPDPVFDGADCGKNRFHVMKRIDAQYAPTNWTVWFVQARGICGESDQKFGCAAIRLRMIRPEVLWRIGRFGYLRGANLRGAGLSRATLSGADLSRAGLSRANLSRANLSEADLSRANLSGANLSEADLSGAGLSEADLSGADLRGADLSRAGLSRATLSGADLRGANLRGAGLSRATLSRADLSGANLSRANLSGADLSRANLSRAGLLYKTQLTKYQIEIFKSASWDVSDVVEIE